MDELPETFLITGPVWLLTGTEWPASYEQHCRGIRRLRTANNAGGNHDFVAAFTDADLAERYIEAGTHGEELTTVRLPIPGPFVKALRMLLNYGDTHIGFDPEEADASGNKNIHVFEIPTVIQSVQRAPKEKGPDDHDPGIR